MRSILLQIMMKIILTFYKPETNELKERFKMPLQRLDLIIEQSKMLVEIAGKVKYEFEQELGIENEKLIE